jgi:single-strand DNA-binding protein
LIEGTLMENPRLEYTVNETPVCTLSLRSVSSVNSGGRRAYESNTFNVEVTGKLAEACHRTGRGGRECRVVGRLRQDRRTGPGGRPESKIIIIADHIEFKPESTKVQRLTCDRCGKDIEQDWYDGEGPVCAGNCTGCGDDLCKDCAVSWDEDGRCQSCQDKDRKEG